MWRVFGIFVNNPRHRNLANELMEAEQLSEVHFWEVLIACLWWTFRWMLLEAASTSSEARSQCCRLSIWVNISLSLKKFRSRSHRPYIMHLSITFLIVLSTSSHMLQMRWISWLCTVAWEWMSNPVAFLFELTTLCKPYLSFLCLSFATASAV